MKVSLNQVVRFAQVELPAVDELVQRINQQLGGVEEVIDLAEKYKDAKIVHVVSVEKHPNADRLSVCQIDAGTGELVQVVCGAPNVHADMWAVWLPPESTVPATYSDTEPFVLGARELRGVMSNGMLAAGDELDLNDDHDGIIELTEYDMPEGVALEAGASFADSLGLNDTIIDIENKMFTHRPDLFGQLGVAREVTAILGGVTDPSEGAQDTRFKNPDWYWKVPEFAAASGAELTVFNDTPEKVPRATFLTLQNVEVKPSPLWLQCELVAMGAKPINNVVDLTNYAMLVTAQPTHAYDYGKIRGATIGARQARAGEKVTLLNGKEFELDEDDIVIADAEGPVALGGVMGGLDCEVSADTKTVVLEVATFDMYAVRKTSMRHGLFTDALTRFNKGQSPLQTTRVMSYLSQLMQSIVGATPASRLYDTNEDLNRQDSVHGQIRMTTEFVTRRLGVQLTTDQIGNLLRRVNFASVADDAATGAWHTTAPYWRTDIELPEDVVEEVGRLYGFDKLPVELPRRSAAPVAVNELIRVKQAFRQSLAQAGGNEVLTYSFVHENVLKKAGQAPDQAWQLSNALSPDLQFYRLSIVPSLLDKIHANVRAGHGEFMLYEVGKVHHAELFDEDEMPDEPPRVAGVYASADAKDTAYFRAKRLLEYAVDRVAPGAELRFVRADDASVIESLDVAFKQAIAPFDAVRTAVVYAGEQALGVVGELKSSVMKSFKLPRKVAAFEIDPSVLTASATRLYTPLSKYPSTQRDVSYHASTQTTYADIERAARDAIEQGEDVRVDIAPVSLYRPEDSDERAITLRYTITPQHKTLSSDEATEYVDRITGQIVQATGCRVEA